MTKSKISSIHFLAILAILNLFLFVRAGHAQTVFSGTSATSTSDSSSTPVTSGADSTSSSTTDASNTNGDGPGRDFHHDDFHRSDRRRQNMRIFYLGVCSGQILAQQGTYLSDISSGSTTADPSDLKTAIKAAIQTCKAQARANGGSPAASPTPAPSATPAPPTSPTGTTTTTVSES